MHAGDKPYVVSPTGQVDLANRGLTLEAVNGVVNQLLPAALQEALQEFGAVQYELPAMPEFPGEHFTVVAARGGDDLWTEIRRRRVPDDDSVPEEFFGSSGAAPAAEAVASAVAQQAAAPPAPISQNVAPPPPPPAWQVTPLPPVVAPVLVNSQEAREQFDDDPTFRTLPAVARRRAKTRRGNRNRSRRRPGDRRRSRGRRHEADRVACPQPAAIVSSRSWAGPEWWPSRRRSIEAPPAVTSRPRLPKRRSKADARSRGRAPPVEVEEPAVVYEPARLSSSLSWSRSRK